MVCSKVFIFTVFAMCLQLAIKNVVEDFEVAAEEGLEKHQPCRDYCPDLCCQVEPPEVK